MRDGRHAFVTGAGSGIGKAIALRLAAEGYRLTLAGRRQQAIDAVAEQIAANGGGVLALGDLDVTDDSAVKGGIAKAQARFGDIAVLVNAAGAAPSAPFEKITPAQWRQVLAVNLDGVFIVSQAALPSLKRAGGGRIVNIASTAGLTGYAYVAAYCAAKHGVVGLTRALALELASSDVTVNAVCPGFTDTPLIDDAIATIVAKTGRSPEQARAGLAASNPQGRLVTVDEVAHTVMWLVSEGATAITGQAIAVAGGEVLAG
ncbi:MAG: SDR family NAD(P)-dependent oxidoreductase [Sphingomonadales bacterium]